MNTVRCVVCDNVLLFSARAVGSGMCHACGHKLYFQKQVHVEMKRLRRKIFYNKCELAIAKHTINELRDILPDPTKLKTLAYTFDHFQDEGYWGNDNTNTDVQDDLRKWAEDIEKILHTKEAIAKEDL